MGEEKQAFHEWLAEQTGRADPVGDLARDVEADTHFPRTRTFDCDRYIAYMKARNAISSAIGAMRQAWIEYERFRRGKKVVLDNPDLRGPGDPIPEGVGLVRCSVHEHPGNIDPETGECTCCEGFRWFVTGHDPQAQKTERSEDQ